MFSTCAYQATELVNKTSQTGLVDKNIGVTCRGDSQQP